jgi:hypothetical protein
MNNYAFNLSEGLYGSDKIKESEQYFLMAIELGNVESMHNYACNLS